MNMRPLAWFRVVLPHGTVVAAAVLAFVLIEVMYLTSVARLGGGADNILRTRDVLLLVACFAYGAYRVLAFHPLALPDYRRWLEATPWRWGKPLPVGPIQLVPQDVVLLGLLLLVCHDPQFPLWRLPLAFMYGYLAALCLCTWCVGVWWAGYALAFGLGLMTHLIAQPVAAFSTATACYLIGYVGLWFSFKQFPWNLPWYLEAGSFQAIAEKQKTRMLGWPYDRLQPKRPELQIAYHDGFLTSLLVAWWSFVLITKIPADAHPRTVFFVFTPILAGNVGGLIRIGAYCSGFQSPINLWGRLFTMRWIIPGYDRVFVAPALMMIVGSILPGLLRFRFDVPLELASPAALALVLLIGLNMGPTLEVWRMTGSHRIVSGFTSTGFAATSSNPKSEFQEL